MNNINYMNNKNLIKNIQLVYFKYHTAYILIIFLIIYIFELIIGININYVWFIKCIGTIIGFYFNDVLINYYIIKYNIYIQNILKYICIFLFQALSSKLFISNYTLLKLSNIIKINLYIFIYFLLDIITDVTIMDNNINKNMYIDIIKTLIGFIIVENLVNSKINQYDYIYIIIFCIALIIYYRYFDNYVKNTIFNIL